MSTPPPVVEHGAGLVVMLDAAGRTIATLEQRVEQLTAALLAERQERQRLTELLEELRHGANTTDVPARHARRRREWRP